MPKTLKMDLMPLLGSTYSRNTHIPVERTMLLTMSLSFQCRDGGKFDESCTSLSLFGNDSVKCVCLLGWDMRNPLCHVMLSLLPVWLYLQAVLKQRRTTAVRGYPASTFNEWIWWCIKKITANRASTCHMQGVRAIEIKKILISRSIGNN